MPRLPVERLPGEGLSSQRHGMPGMGVALRITKDMTTEEKIRRKHRSLLALPPNRRDMVIKKALLLDSLDGNCVRFTNRLDKTFYKYI